MPKGHYPRKPRNTGNGEYPPIAPTPDPPVPLLLKELERTDREIYERRIAKLQEIIQLLVGQV